MGKIPTLTNIFQMGRNHQLENWTPIEALKLDEPSISTESHGYTSQISPEGFQT